MSNDTGADSLNIAKKLLDELTAKKEAAEAEAQALRKRNKALAQRNRELSAAATQNDTLSIEAMLEKRDGMFERMRLEAQVAGEAANAREALRMVEQLKQQVAALTVEVSSRPSVLLLEEQFQAQQQQVMCMEQQLEAQRSLLELAAARSQESAVAAEAAQEQARLLAEAAAAAERRAVEVAEAAERRVAEEHLALERAQGQLLLAVAEHEQQLQNVQKRSAALITSVMRIGMGGGNAAATSVSPGATEKDSEAEVLEQAVMKLLTGLYAGEVAEEDAARKLAALNCDLQLIDAPAVSTEPLGPKSPEPSSSAPPITKAYKVTEDNIPEAVSAPQASPRLLSVEASSSAPASAANSAAMGSPSTTAPRVLPEVLQSPRATPVAMPEASLGMGSSNFIMSDPRKLMRLIERASAIRHGTGTTAPSTLALSKAGSLSEGGGLSSPPGNGAADGSISGASAASMPFAEARPQPSMAPRTSHLQPTTPTSLGDSTNGGSNSSASWVLRLSSLGSALGRGAAPADTDMQRKVLSEGGVPALSAAPRAGESAPPSSNSSSNGPSQPAPAPSANKSLPMPKFQGAKGQGGVPKSAAPSGAGLLQVLAPARDSVSPAVEGNGWDAAAAAYKLSGSLGALKKDGSDNDHALMRGFSGDVGMYLGGQSRG